MGEVIDSHPQSRVSNSQPEGIGRVAPVGELCAWNNLGRNVVFADHDLRVVAVYDETEYPDDDEPSQFDLDVHAIVDVPEHGLVATLNHLGRLRAFRRSDIRRQWAGGGLRPTWTVDLLDDVERLVAVGGRLVGSRPRREHAGGIFMSDPIDAGNLAGRLDVEVHLESVGEVTALAAWPPELGQGLIIGSEGAVRLAPIELGRPHLGRVEVEVDFRPMAVGWSEGLVWSAGPTVPDDFDDYDWESLHGGGFVGFDPRAGEVMVTGEFPIDLAWGTGGAAVVLMAGALCGIGRRGEVVVFDSRDGRHVGTLERAVVGSLGMAHAAVIGTRVLFGGNRDGYRLHVRGAPTIRGLLRPQEP